MRKFFLAAVLVLMAGGAQAATLHVVGGQLMGASGVMLENSAYDVEFHDGTCFGLFDLCNDTSDFLFDTQADATLASQALLDQVFLDSGIGNFDSDPDLTNGCNRTTGELSFNYCVVYTPYGFENNLTSTQRPLSSVARNYVSVTEPPNVADSVASGQAVGDLDNFSNDPTRVYAVWTLGFAVPEPNTALLVGIGLAGIAARRRPRR